MSEKGNLDKDHFNGYDCKKGRHKIQLPHGQQVKLCDKCFKAYMKGKENEQETV